VRILLWHGYLLGGTGSNVYTRALAREWSNAGHDVVVVSQEREPEQYNLGGAQTVAVDLPGGLLPVFVMDRYAGLRPKFMQDFSGDEQRAYVEANAAALRELLPADLVFANHALMGGPVGLASGAPLVRSSQSPPRACSRTAGLRPGRRRAKPSRPLSAPRRPLWRPQGSAAWPRPLPRSRDVQA